MCASTLWLEHVCTRTPFKLGPSKQRGHSFDVLSSLKKDPARITPPKCVYCLQPNEKEILVLKTKRICGLGRIQNQPTCTVKVQLMRRNRWGNRDLFSLIKNIGFLSIQRGYDLHNFLALLFLSVATLLPRCPLPFCRRRRKDCRFSCHRYTSKTMEQRRTMLFSPFPLHIVLLLLFDVF